MMIAAIYARKSTAQHDTDDEMKSVSRQIEAARIFATSKGARVEDAYVYADDAVSGAETRKLVARQRLLSAIGEAGRPPFDVIIMRDASRFSRRDGDEAFGELKRLAQRGVEIWFYGDGTRFTFGTLGDNVVGFVRAEMNAEYRRQIAKWTHDAKLRQAKAGHVTGGRVFGYDIVPIDGHKERRINDDEAAVVRRIFDFCATGIGYSRIAKQLNADGALAPKPMRGRPAGWSPSSVREVLHRRLYRGEVIYNQTRRRTPDGATGFARRPESEWVRVDRPELRIVSADTWDEVQTRLTDIRTRLQEASGGRAGRRRRDADSAYLLPGFARCATCGGSVGVMNRGQYGCIAYHRRGTTVCRNGLKKSMATLDAAVLEQLRMDLRPKAVQAVIDGLLAALAPKTLAHDLRHSRSELQTLDREITNLADAIAQGGQLTVLLDRLRARQARRDDVAATIARKEALDVTRIDRTKIARTVQAAVAEWHATLTGGVIGEVRQMFREILVGPLMLTPEGRTYRFEGELLVGRLLVGLIGLPTYVVRPARLERATSWFVGRWAHQPAFAADR